MRYWISTSLPVREVRRRAMLYFAHAPHEMALIAREPSRLLFTASLGDLTVEMEAGRPGRVSVVTTHWHAEGQAFLAEHGEPVDGVIHYETAAARPPLEVLRLAREHLGRGPEGLGLDVTVEEPGRLEFTGGGGRVAVHAWMDGQPRVHVAAKRWIYPAEQFVRQVSAER